MIKLITDVLANGLDKSYRENLISNFKAIEEKLNLILKNQDQLSKDFSNLKKNNAREFATFENNVNSGIKTQFKTINKDMTNLSKNFQYDLDTQSKDLTKRINRIILGTDDESLEIVVREILKEEGVIK